MTGKPFNSQFSRTTQKIQNAQALALEAHRNQKYGLHPYSKHLEAVIECLERFGFKAREAKGNPLFEDIICAGWLHDVAEDTEVSLAQIEDQFGADVRDIVARVTDEKAPTREERKALTYPKIRGHFGATVVKLADRIANVKASWGDNEKQFKKYVEEQKKFREAVYIPNLAEPMWNSLRFWTNQKFNVKPAPLDEAQFFYEECPDLKIVVTATIEDADLRFSDYAIGERLVAILNGDGDDEREIVVTVKSDFKDSVLLALLQQRFSGNCAISEIQEWLAENGIPSGNWFS